MRHLMMVMVRVMVMNMALVLGRARSCHEYDRGFDYGDGYG